MASRRWINQIPNWADGDVYAVEGTPTKGMWPKPIVHRLHRLGHILHRFVPKSPNFQYKRLKF